MEYFYIRFDLKLLPPNFETSLHRVRFQLFRRISFAHQRILFKSTLNQFVSVEFGSTQKSPARSPTKVYIPLEVAAIESENPPQPVQSTSENTPVLTSQSAADPPGFVQPLEQSTTRNDDGIEQVIVDNLDASLSPKVLVIQETTETDKGDSPQNPACDVSPLLPNLSSMAVNDPFLQDVTEAAEALNSYQTTSPRFSSFLKRAEETDHAPGTSQMIGCGVPLSESTPENPLRDILVRDDIQGLSSDDPPKMVITRREVLAVTSILGRIPQTVLNDPDPASTNDFTFSVIEDPPVSPDKVPARETTARDPDEPMTQSSCDDMPIPSGKRRRPKYSLKPHMMRKHPVLKFFATGPIDRQKTPYKWWCRVCRVELPLMSRGVLELLSHFKTDSHLIEEHRIRLEIPGVTLYDRSEKALTGSALQEAKRVAKETYPIAPQLDACRLLVGQDRLPDFSTASNPSEDVISQIAILEYGLRHGGDVDTLSGMWNEMVRLFPRNSQESTFSWNRERLLLSFHSWANSIP